jgi:uncharacterized tellurite resistance protein B-like protein
MTQTGEEARDAPMTLWAKFKDLVDRVGGHEGPPTTLREEELRLAAAALLVHASTIDGHVDAVERRKLKELLQARFDLDGHDLRKLLNEADAREMESVDLYQFTSVLARALDQDGRKRIVEMLWEIALADGVVHEFEANLVWRAAELLGVSTRDRVTLRKAVESRYARC